MSEPLSRTPRATVPTGVPNPARVNRIPRAEGICGSRMSTATTMARTELTPSPVRVEDAADSTGLSPTMMGGPNMAMSAVTTGMILARQSEQFETGEHEYRDTEHPGWRRLRLHEYTGEDADDPRHRHHQVDVDAQGEPDDHQCHADKNKPASSPLLLALIWRGYIW
jgi:hypothetical protein